MSKSTAAVLVMHSHGLGITFHLAQLARAMSRTVDSSSLDLYVASVAGEQFAGLWNTVKEQYSTDHAIVLDDDADLARIVKTLLKSHENVVINVQGLRQLKSLMQLKKQHRGRLRIVLTINSFRNGTWKRVPYSALMYLLCRRVVDLTVFLSPFSSHEFVGGRALLARGAATIIPWGVEPWNDEVLSTPEDRVGDPDLREIIAYPNRVRLVYLATFSKLKGHLWLIRGLEAVIKQHPDLQVILAGDGPMLSSATALVRQLDVADQILLPGRIQRSHIPWLVSHCDGALVGSRSETFGHTFVEPMVAGLPVVGTRVGVGEWALQDYVTGIGIPFGNQDALARAVSLIVGDADLRRFMGSNAAEMLRPLLTWENTARAYLTLYEVAMERPQ